MRRALAQLQESLRLAVGQQERTNGELHSANEEVQSANEELQSINEELETSREQLQSSNEQLQSVNEELLNRSLELSAVNVELNGLLASIQIPVVLVDAGLRIRRFTAAAQHLFNLLPADIGRPVEDLNLVFSCPMLSAHLRDVIDCGANKEFDVEDKTGSRFSIRLRPYHNEGSAIDGASIITLNAGC
jgi:two-component system CheB/CheR fusion protein